MRHDQEELCKRETDREMFEANQTGQAKSVKQLNEELNDANMMRQARRILRDIEVAKWNS